MARFNWNKREIFFLFFFTREAGWRWKTFWNGTFSFFLQLRRGFAAHKISRSCSICRLNCQQRPEEKQRVLNNLNFIFFNGKFNICPWSLKSISFFRLSFFYCMCFYAGIQKYFYLYSCFISDTVWWAQNIHSQKWGNFKYFFVLLLCVAAAVNCILRRGRELRKCNYFQNTFKQHTTCK